MAQYDSTQNGQAPNIFMSFACGAVTGAALALFFAPATGRDTREYLQRRSRELANDVTDRGREMWNQQRDTVLSAVEKGREKLNEFTGQIGEAVEQGKAGYREAKQRMTGAGVMEPITHTGVRGSSI